MKVQSEFWKLSQYLNSQPLISTFNPDGYLLSTTLDAIGTFDKNPASQSWIGGMKLRWFKYFLGKIYITEETQRRKDTETEKFIQFFSRRMHDSSKQLTVNRHFRAYLLT